MSYLRQQMLDRMTLRGFSKSTQSAYIRWIERLAKFHRLAADKLSDTQLQSFLLDLIENKKLSSSSCRQALHSIRFFYAQVLNRQISRLVLPNMKQGSKIPELLSRQEVFDIIRACRDPKYQTMMLVGYGTGIRLNEITHLRVKDIDSDRQVLRISQGKGKKDRYVILDAQLLDVLRRYWQLYRPTGPLFYGKDMRYEASGRTLYKHFRRCLQRAGVHKQVGVHGLRHAFATHSLERGMPLAKLQQLLGHKQITTTLRYIHWLPRYKEQPGEMTQLLVGWEEMAC
ncbi:MAG: integrase/recombinase XerD [Flavobacterium sp.]|jgi:integrase/recombinase XerD